MRRRSSSNEEEKSIQDGDTAAANVGKYLPPPFVIAVNDD